MTEDATGFVVEYDDEEVPPPPPELVRVCGKCGRGFTGWGPTVGNMDGLPTQVISGQAIAPICGGRIYTLNRLTHIEAVGKVLLQIALHNKAQGPQL
jgi:hypothetical protein